MQLFFQPSASTRRLLSRLCLPTSLLLPGLLALFLGASALGLLARKKVQKPRPSGTGVDQQSRREAEERVDEIQALNLLVGAWVLPEATEIETEKQLCAWREMAAEPVLGLVKGRAPGSANRSTLAGILSLTSRATDSSFQADFEPTRLALVDWSWRSFSAASPPTTVEVAVPVATHSDPLLHAFLSSIYPAGRVLDSAKSVRLVGANPDRAVLNGIARRLADPSVTPSDDLLASLAEAAMRAHRLDLLVSLLERDPPLPARLRLSLACKGVDILSRRRGQGDWRVEVVALVNGLTRAVEDMPSFEQADLDRLHRTLRHLVRGAYSGFALERRLASILLFVLRQSPEAAVQHDQFVTSGLRHLTQARHPRLAQRVLAAIPAPLVRLEHYEAVLSSSHAPTAQATFDALLRNDSLYPRLETFLAFLRSHASQTTSSASLQAAYRTICVMNWLDIPKTIDVYNLLFRVLARHGSDRALLRILRSMDEAGIKPNKETMAVLASREMVRRDTQTRRIVSHTALGEREVRLIERPRRGGAIAQQRKVAAAVREWEGKLAAVERTKEERDAEANKPPVAPNVLLKSIARWTREYQPAALVRLAKEQLGVDLAPLVADPKAKEAVVVRPPPHELTFAWYNTVRRPAYRLFATGLENRGERRLAEVLRRLARAEEKVVGALEAERRRAKKAGQGQEQPRRRRQEPEA
ncbi:hypothetical protein JCM10207_000760 [Rhodosporidiobolus poonsookiae]